RSRLVAMLLDGVTVGALALMAVVTWQLSRVAVVDLATAALLVASAILLLRFRLSSTWLIVAGAGLGMILSIVRAHCAPSRGRRGTGRVGADGPAARFALGRFEHDDRYAAIGRPRLVFLVAGVELH